MYSTVEPNFFNIKQGENEENETFDEYWKRLSDIERTSNYTRSNHHLQIRSHHKRQESTRQIHQVTITVTIGT